MISWIKRKLGIEALEVENKKLKRLLQDHEDFVFRKVSDLKEYTRVDADIGERGNNTIILTGVYRDKAFVKFYDLGDGEFVRLVEQMGEMKDHYLIRNIDRPPSMAGGFFNI